MARHLHMLAVGRTPADVPGGAQPTFSRGVALRIDNIDGSRLPAAEFPGVAALAGAPDVYFVRFATPDGKADRRELALLRSQATFVPVQFGEGSRIEYLDASAAPGVYLVQVETVDHLWEAGLPGPCPCGLARCGQPEPREV